MVSYQVIILIDYVSKLNIESFFDDQVTLNVVADNILDLNNKLEEIFKKIKSSDIYQNYIIEFTKEIISYHNNKFNDCFIDYDFEFYKGGISISIYPSVVNSLAFNIKEKKIKYYRINMIINYLRRAGLSFDEFSDKYKNEFNKILFILDEFSKINDNWEKMIEKYSEFEENLKKKYELFL